MRGKKRKVIAIKLDENSEQEFESLRDAEKGTGCSYVSIYCICAGRYGKTKTGYSFRYADDGMAAQEVVNG